MMNNCCAWQWRVSGKRFFFSFFFSPAFLKSSLPKLYPKLHTQQFLPQAEYNTNPPYMKRGMVLLKLLLHL
ncbi:unnamed protein product [Linum tenue]|uniref:Secreted protein n=1 Tax=Linum tenue TaxID=586396 RepID=A0AAV0KNH3_9ROSI|nr:unnamed protein product [Linum tenue]